MSDEVVNPIGPAPFEPVADGSAVGIKETLEVVAFVNALAEALEKVLADGKVTLLDARHALAVVQPANVALKGASEIKKELADLGPGELETVATGAVEAVYKLVAAFSKVK